MLDKSATINTVVFIDAQLPNYQTLIAGLPDNSIYFVLDAQKDGIEQIEQFLASYSNLDSIQILSHGSEGSLYLGNTVLSNNTLKKYQDQLSNIGSHLKDTGDILLYGCNVAQGDAGLQFIDALAKTTGADVAASNDITGSVALGGDWLLETNTGSIEAALNMSTLNSYLDILAINTPPTFIIGDGKVTTLVNRCYSSQAYSVTAQVYGKILLGEGANGAFALVQYKTDGSVDTSFKNNGTTFIDLSNSNDQIRSVTVQYACKNFIRWFNK